MAPPTGFRPPAPGPSSRLAGLAALLRSHNGFADVVGSLEEGHGATIGGTWGSSSALAAASLASQLSDERILVVVLPHGVDAERFVDDLALFTDLPVAHLPALETFAVGDEEAAEDPATAGRLLLVKRLTMPGGERPKIVVTSIQALLPPLADPREIADTPQADGNYLLVTKIPAGGSSVYWAGAGWDRSGDFANLAAWDAYLDAFAARQRAPLTVTLGK